MTNKPWECPRCKRINAPFNPTCFCSPEKKSEYVEDALVYLNGLKKPLFTFDEVDQEIKNSRCFSCGNYR